MNDTKRNLKIKVNESLKKIYPITERHNYDTIPHIRAIRKINLESLIKEKVTEVLSNYKKTEESIYFDMLRGVAYEIKKYLTYWMEYQHKYSLVLFAQGHLAKKPNTYNIVDETEPRV